MSLHMSTEIQSFGITSIICGVIVIVSVAYSIYVKLLTLRLNYRNKLQYAIMVQVSYVLLMTYNYMMISLNVGIYYSWKPFIQELSLYLGQYLSSVTYLFYLNSQFQYVDNEPDCQTRIQYPLCITPNRHNYWRYYTIISLTIFISMYIIHLILDIVKNTVASNILIAIMHAIAMYFQVMLIYSSITYKQKSIYNKKLANYEFYSVIIHSMRMAVDALLCIILMFSLVSNLRADELALFKGYVYCIGCALVQVNWFFIYRESVNSAKNFKQDLEKEGLAVTKIDVI